MNAKIDHDDLPAVTFFLFSYNQRQYIEAACQAALAQTYSPLEIVFSDDCSIDGTFEEIQKVVKSYQGPHKVILNRNARNLGLIEHVNKSFQIASGDLIVAAAGDDISMSNRVQEIVAAYQKSKGTALVIHSSAIKINDINAELGLFIPPIIEYQMSLPEVTNCMALYIGATGAWNRRIYNEFGPIVCRDAYEDLIFGFRAAVKGALVYIDKPLVRYRFSVGLSRAHDHSKLNFSERIALRKKHNKRASDVYKQRLLDVAEVGDAMGADVRLIRSRLARLAPAVAAQYLLYDSPAKLFGLIFTPDSVRVLKGIASEIKYLVISIACFCTHEKNQ